MDPAFTSRGARVHFVLDGLDVRAVAEHTTRRVADHDYVPITTSELRYAFRYWRELSRVVAFYVGGVEVEAPWLAEWTRTSIEGPGIDVREVSSARDAWARYGEDRRARLGAALETRTLLDPR